MIANYQQPGSAIDYPNGTSSAIAAGQVVSLTTRIGVAGTDIPASAVGSLYVKGVFAMPKAQLLTLAENMGLDAKDLTKAKLVEAIAAAEVQAEV